MPQRYNTREGDTADLIAWRHYGRQDSRIMEQLIDANPTLADKGPILPAGLQITLPDITIPAEVTSVALWD